jgi:hypothetical protein
MTPSKADDPRRVTWPRATLLLLWSVVAAPGCSFLADEFTTLDRPSPVVVDASERGSSGTVERP